MEPQKLEKGIYKLRAMISQMANHKTKGRLVPKQFRCRIDALFAMVRRTDEHKASEEITGESDDEAEVLEVPKVEEDVELIQSSQDVDKDALFDTPDPALRALLRGDENSSDTFRRRLIRKMRVPSSQTIDSEDACAEGTDRPQV